MNRSGLVTARYAVATGVLGLALLFIAPIVSSQSASCGLATPAFCDNFNQGPAAARGRGGDLDSTKWSAARLAPTDFSGFGPVANPVETAPVPPCKASLNASSVYPNNDTLICDASGTRSPQLMTAVVAQNYGNNSYLIRQPFDFTNRTGKIVFDVDAATMGPLAGYIEIDVTEDPSPAPTFQEYQNFEAGPVPRNGLMMKWLDTCGNPGGTSVTLNNTMVYTNYSAAIISPTFTVWGADCVRTRQGALNHFEINVSRQHVDVYGSDYSTDNGQSYPNLRRIYSADLNLAFQRGYVHIAARNHATKKYGYGDDWVFHWDNIGFDGPVIPAGRAYEIPDNNTAGNYSNYGNAAIMNLGYLLLDGTTGKPAGVYDPVNRLPAFQIQNVNISGATGARLSLNVGFNTITHTADASWGLSYRFNGGTWRNRQLTAGELTAINTAGSAGNVSMVIDVPLADIRSGLNTLDFLPLNAPMDLAPVIANIDLVIATNGASAPAPPVNLRIQ